MYSRLLAIGSAEGIDNLATGARPAADPRNAWTLADIRAGLPTVFENTVEAFVPQMANLQLVGGVSFTKGCYTGQEIVARMQYLGKLKRRMYLAHVDSAEAPTAGDPLFSPQNASGSVRARSASAS